jgi:hypothetical protein
MEVWAYIDCQQKGEAVCVYIDPQKPERSSIEPGTVRYGKFLVVGFAFVLLAMVLYAAGHPLH